MKISPQERPQRFCNWTVSGHQKIVFRCTQLLSSIFEFWDSESYSSQLALSLPPSLLLQLRWRILYRRISEVWRDVEGIEGIDFAMAAKSEDLIALRSFQHLGFHKLGLRFAECSYARVLFGSFMIKKKKKIRMLKKIANTKNILFILVCWKTFCCWKTYMKGFLQLF